MVEVTSRVMQSRFLLRPSPEVNRTIIGILARAQKRYNMTVHLVVVLSNHMHFLLSPRDQRQLSRFMGFVNGNIARKVGKLQGWREKFWGRRYQGIVVTHQKTAQLGRLRYLLEQGVKEGLVLSPLDWPGVTSTHALVDATFRMAGTWTDETELYRARLKENGENDRRSRKRRRRRGIRRVKERDFRSQEVLFLTPLPCWRDRSRAWVAAQVKSLVEEIEREAQQRHQTAGSRPKGREAILRQEIFGKPRNTKRSPAPRVHASSRDARFEFLSNYQAFLSDYRKAARALRRGIGSVRFPLGCFPPPKPFLAWDPG